MDSEEVERYSLGVLSADEAAPFDEHLLICEQCQAKVEASDAYIAAMRGAARLIRETLGERQPRGRPATRARTAGAC